MTTDASRIIRIRPVTSEAEWAFARAVRQRVFVEEQQCPTEEEWDAFDEVSRHLIALVGEDVVGTARWRTVPFEEQLSAKLERFAILPAYRGRGFGRSLVAYAIDDARRAGFFTYVLHAQAYLEAFYTSLGFTSTGERFMEAGIPHVAMVRRDASSAP
jgi:predicted GNAT family N-acyltransferase